MDQNVKTLVLDYVITKNVELTFFLIHNIPFGSILYYIEIEIYDL